MEEKITLSIVIVSFGTKEITKNCLESIVKHTTGVGYELIVVDNASTDGSVEMLRQFCKENKNVVVVENATNVGFAQGNNQGAKKASGDYILFLNSDTQINDNALATAVSWLQTQPMVGVV